MKIKFLSYNILQKPVGIVEEGKNEYKSARMEILGNELKNYDIICLQECFNYQNYRVYNFLKKLEKNGFKYFLKHDSPKFHKYQTIDSGLMILSKFPIVDSLKKIFVVGVYNDGLIDKGMLYAKIQVDADIDEEKEEEKKKLNNKDQKNINEEVEKKKKYIHVINIHTQAVYMYKPLQFKYCCFIKNLVQLLDIKKFLKKKIESIPDKDLILLAGDFNIEANKLADEDFIKFFKFINYNPKFINLDEIETMYDYFESIVNYNNKIFHLNNIYADHHKKHAITFGKFHKDENGNIICNETVLTRKDETQDNASLDHIFHVKKMNSKNKCLFKIVDKSACIEEFYVEDEKHVFTQLSDHFGISCEIIY